MAPKKSKVKLSDLAKDFGLKNAELINILKPYSEKAPTAQKALETKDLDIIFDTLTLAHSSKDPAELRRKSAMPIKIPGNLPAARTLEEENIFVMTEHRAMTQDIRPLRILILNLMPTKITTETQLARLLGNTPLQVEIELMSMSGRTPKNTPKEHMLAFYRNFESFKNDFFDGMIITGAPVEQMPFEAVAYWKELCDIFEWSKSHVHSTFHICWGAQAGLYYHYGIPKIYLPKKLFGVFRHRVTRKGSILFRGSDDVFMVPHSRHTTIMKAPAA